MSQTLVVLSQKKKDVFTKKNYFMKTKNILTIFLAGILLIGCKPASNKQNEKQESLTPEERESLAPEYQDFFDSLDAALESYEEEVIVVVDKRDNAYKKKKLSWEEEYDSILVSLGIQSKDPDGILKEICDTSYIDDVDERVRIKGAACPFQPHLLVVNDNKILLFSEKLDSIYTLETPFLIQTASSYSTYQNQLKIAGEIFLLAKSKPDYLYGEQAHLYRQYYPENYFDLVLYRYNIDSLYLERVTKFYDNTIPLHKLYFELAGYFPKRSYIIFDTRYKYKAYYDCVSIHPDPTYAENNKSFKVDIESRKTELGELVGPGEYSNDIGYEVKLYSNNLFPRDHNFEIKQTEESVIISNIPDGNPDIELPFSIFNDKPIGLDKGVSKFEYLDYNICYTKNQKAIISVCREEEMGILRGNIYLVDLESNEVSRLIDNEVIGYDVILKEFSFNSESHHKTFLDKCYLIDVMNGKDGNSELYLYDDNFNLLHHFDNMQYYEEFN